MSHYDMELGTGERPKRKPPSVKRTAQRSTGGLSVRRPSHVADCGGTVEERYEEAIAAYGSGATWDEKITYWGTALYSREYDLSEMDADAIDDSFVDEIADAIRADVDGRGAGVPSNRVADVRRGVVTALRKMIARAWEWRGSGGKTFIPRAKKPTPPPPHAAHVRNLIDAGGGMGCSDAVRELSPCWCVDWLGKPPSAQTELFMRAAFRPDEVLHIFRDDVATAGVPWINLRRAADWIERMPYETLPGDLIVPNPFTGKIGTKTDGKPSFIAKDCLAAFPFAVLEMDDAKYHFSAQGDVEKGLAMQCAFWRGFILKSNFAPALVSLTYSGGKSIHGLLHVGATNLDEWNAARKLLISFFATDPENVIGADGRDKFPFRVDVQALEPRQGVRLPGVRRRDNGRAQTLLYLNPRARAGNMWRGRIQMPPPPIDPDGKPPCDLVRGDGMCGVCERLTDCPFADSGATAGTTTKGGVK